MLSFRWLTAAGIAISLFCSGCSEADNSTPASESLTTQSPVPPITLKDLANGYVTELCGGFSGFLVDGELDMSKQNAQAAAFTHLFSWLSPPASEAFPPGTPVVAIGDLTGDGVDDGVSVTSCGSGGNASFAHTIHFYSAGEHVASYNLYSVNTTAVDPLIRASAAGMHEFYIRQGALHATWNASLFDDANCCPQAQVSAVFTLTGSDVVVSDIQRVK